MGKNSFEKNFKEITKRQTENISDVSGTDYKLKDGSIVIAAITSCTNTSNPNVIIGAGLLAKKAIEKGVKLLKTKKGILIIAGKGHENIQIYKDKNFTFNDRLVAKSYAKYL